MPWSFEEIFESFRFADALDIGVGMVLFAAIFQWIRIRSAHSLLITAIAVGTLYLLSNWLRMYVTLAMFQTGLSLLLFALIVIFQNDLRNAFERLTTWNPFHSRQRSEPRAVFSETLVEACALLADDHVGALIVLPGRHNLERHLRGGILLDGHISIPLMDSIFHPESQGHDGAAIIRGRRIHQFGVHLPLSKNIAELGPGGTRHAAALGLSERSDALVIVVSEERGEISIARYGRLRTLTSAAELAETLDEFYQPRSKPQSLGSRLREFTEMGLILTMSFLASGFLWLSFANDVDTVQRVVDPVPIISGDVPENWIIESIEPDTVRLNIAGSKRAFNTFAWNKLSAHLDFSKIEEGEQTVFLGEEAFDLPREMSVVSIEPNVLRVIAYETRLVELPIQPQTRGEPAKGYALSSATPAPGQIRVRVRLSLISEVTGISTEPINVAGLTTSQTRQVNLVLPKGVWPAPNSPTSAKVELTIAPAKNQTPKG